MLRSKGTLVVKMGVLILCDGREDNIIQTNGKLG